jgi:nicotinamidase-related amidase
MLSRNNIWKWLSLLLCAVVIAGPLAFADDRELQIVERERQHETSAASASDEEGKKPMVTPDFFENCAFVSIDIQEMGEFHPIPNTESLPKGWQAQGFTAEDCNAGTEYLVEVAMPNAEKAIRAARTLDLPIVLVHWGYQFWDGMDLAPAVRREFLGQYGEDYARWPHHISHPSSKPSSILGQQEGDYVLSKSDQDAFTSSNIHFVLQNLGVKNIVFVGGHTGGCLGRSAEHAKRLGYRMLCIEDATWDSRESTRRKRILETGYDYILTTAQFLDAVQAARQTDDTTGTEK